MSIYFAYGYAAGIDGYGPDACTYTDFQQQDEWFAGFAEAMNETNRIK